MPDSAIDFSDIPELTEEQFRSAVRGALKPKSTREVTLFLDEETALWLVENARKEAHSINFALKQALQHGERAERERVAGSQRAIYEQSSEVFRRGLDLLAGRSTSSQYVEIPEYSDEILHSFGLGATIPLRPRNVALFIDEEVYLWLQSASATHTLRIRYALSTVANRARIAAASPSLSKAS